MNVQRVRQKIAGAVAGDKERNRLALARLKARMSFGDLREHVELERRCAQIVELATGVAP